MAASRVIETSSKRDSSKPPKPPSILTTTNKTNILADYCVCQVCQKIINFPIILPCGNTMCKIHVKLDDKKTHITCPFLACSKQHAIPNGNFPENFAIRELERRGGSHFKTGDAYEHAQKNCELIDEAFAKLNVYKRNEIGVKLLKRCEELHRSVNEKAKRLIDQVNKNANAVDSALQKYSAQTDGDFQRELVKSGIQRMKNNVTDWEIELNRLDLTKERENNIAKEAAQSIEQFKNIINAKNIMAKRESPENLIQPFINSKLLIEKKSHKI